jgi:hypothetical protein
MPIYTRRTASMLLALSPAIAVSQSAPSTIVAFALPQALSYPEGIAYDEDANAFYTASAATGLVIRVDVASGLSRTVVPAGALVECPSETVTTGKGITSLLCGTISGVDCTYSRAARGVDALGAVA